MPLNPHQNSPSLHPLLHLVLPTFPEHAPLERASHHHSHGMAEQSHVCERWEYKKSIKVMIQNDFWVKGNECETLYKLLSFLDNETKHLVKVWNKQGADYIPAKIDENCTQCNTSATCQLCWEAGGLHTLSVHQTCQPLDLAFLPPIVQWLD